MSSPSFQQSARGAVLIITLAFLVIITVVIVGLLQTMQLERNLAHTHLERTRAEYFAHMGLDRVVGLLYENIANTNISWVSSPGQIISSGAANGYQGMTNVINLYSGPGTNTTLPGSLSEPNLNIQILEDQNPVSYLITDRTANPINPASGIVQLPLKWIYVRQDGTLDQAEPPLSTIRPTRSSVVSPTGRTMKAAKLTTISLGSGPALVFPAVIPPSSTFPPCPA